MRLTFGIAPYTPVLLIALLGAPWGVLCQTPAINSSQPGVTSRTGPTSVNALALSPGSEIAVTPTPSRYGALGSGASPVSPAAPRASNPQQLQRKMNAVSSLTASGYCFQSGVGWVHTSATSQSAVTFSYQTTPVPVLSALLAARRLPPPANGDGCDTSSTSGSSFPFLGPEVSQPATAVLKTTGEGTGTGNPGQSLVQAPVDSSAPDVQLQSDAASGMSDYEIGIGAPAGGLPLQLLYSGQGYVLTISPPTISTPRSSGSETQSRTSGITTGNQSVLDIHTPDIPIAAFTFGEAHTSGRQDIGSPLAGSKQDKSKGGQSLQQRVPSLSSLAPERSHDAITPRMLHTYRQLRSTCKKLIETEGDTPVEAPIERKVLIFGKTEEPDQILNTCRTFVGMDRNEALRKMAKRRPLR
jgi:hypothetical protein